MTTVTDHVAAHDRLDSLLGPLGQATLHLAHALDGGEIPLGDDQVRDTLAEMVRGVEVTLSGWKAAIAQAEMQALPHEPRDARSLLASYAPEGVP